MVSRVVDFLRRGRRPTGRVGGGVARQRVAGREGLRRPWASGEGWGEEAWCATRRAQRCQRRRVGWDLGDRWRAELGSKGCWGGRARRAAWDWDSCHRMRLSSEEREGEETRLVRPLSALDYTTVPLLRSRQPKCLLNNRYVLPNPPHRNRDRETDRGQKGRVSRPPAARASARACRRGGQLGTTTSACEKRHTGRAW